MATSKIVRIPCAFVLTLALFFSTQLVSHASDDPVAPDAAVETTAEETTETTAEETTEAATEVEDSCCPEGYECTPIESSVEDEDDGPACHGILTCTFFVGGQVIALPFRLLNGLFRIII